MRPNAIPATPAGFIACDSGDLIHADPLLHRHMLVRTNYRLGHATIRHGQDLRAALRAGPYAWPGGYPLYFVTNEGEAMSFASVLERLEEETRAIRDRDSSRIVACAVNYEDPALYCCHSSKRIKSAYAEDDAEDADPFAGSFMQPQVYRGAYFAIDTSEGVEIVPADVIGRTMSTVAEVFANYVSGKISDPDAGAAPRDGWLARMSASGYLDCTDWTAHESEAEAMAHLVEMYGNAE